ncbi:TetR/AcrR family transcriptional regulator [Amycolatopsis sp. 195334CR]|uniref:TetR/AcrR family transcriptional regulator n=1 Tax=Amycolatopsis sp. 195334CR TaxID=2814588 RepID=UPI001A8FBB75|nr:TetR/AcrR family transcriptional regulator [Amycolatopsis sp. 195334CR]MBN6037819.1 TetR/AcrR family transcriptional regulator [Amycolatopsis sp. 195334CR]
MPKRVDHEQRKREFAAALVRCARVRGLHATGFREVAAEAGVSLNLVQYYFPTKEKLLQGGLVYVRERITERLRRLDDPDPEQRVRAILTELLPADEESTDLYCVHAAYAALALTDPALAAQPHAAGPDELHPLLTELLAEAGLAEPQLVAINLLGLATGLSAYVVSGYHPVDTARAALAAQLDLVFGQSI